MKVENFTLEKLIPYSSNNRVHNELQIDRIAESISEFGFNQPIVIDEDNVILVGHGRFEKRKHGNSYTRSRGGLFTVIIQQRELLELPL